MIQSRAEQDGPFYSTMNCRGKEGITRKVVGAASHGSNQEDRERLEGHSVVIDGDDGMALIICIFMKHRSDVGSLEEKECFFLYRASHFWFGVLFRPFTGEALVNAHFLHPFI